jgi:hypothetical protein
MPHFSVNEELHPVVSEISPPGITQLVPTPQPGPSMPQATVTYATPVVNTVPHTVEPIYHADSVGYDRMEDLQDKYNEMQKEMRALRGKDMFGQNAQELCLVHNVVVPHKFKVPDFEKYKGSTCPKAHLVMYARKMSTQTDNDKLLIHCFQDSLTGAALRWYMDLDRTSIRSFNDLANAFIQQYNYNSYMAPDRDELRALSQKEKESFKEYAQRWRELAAQIRPPLEEKELTKLFLNTLSPFYYKKMVASAPNNFNEMVGMGIRLEEGVREGRLSKETPSSHHTKRFGGGYPKKKEHDVGMITITHLNPLIRCTHKSLLSILRLNYPCPKDPLLITHHNFNINTNLHINHNINHPTDLPTNHLIHNFNHQILIKPSTSKEPDPHLTRYQ